MPGAGPEPWKGSGVRWGRSWARVSGGCHRAGVSLGRGPCLRGVWFSSTPPASPAVPDRCLPSRFSLCLSRTFPSIQLALAVASSCISPPPQEQGPHPGSLHVLSALHGSYKLGLHSISRIRSSPLCKQHC